MKCNIMYKRYNTLINHIYKSSNGYKYCAK